MTELKVVDGLAWVRSQVGRFFRGGTPNANELVGHILCDVLGSDNSCAVARRGDWWVVSSEEDWMQHETFAVEELFYRVVPAPQLGPNSMRCEAIVMAFASAIAVADESGWTPVKGQLDSQLQAYRPWEKGTKRSLAFKL